MVGLLGLAPLWVDSVDLARSSQRLAFVLRDATRTSPLGELEVAKWTRSRGLVAQPNWQASAAYAEDFACAGVFPGGTRRSAEALGRMPEPSGHNSKNGSLGSEPAAMVATRHVQVVKVLQKARIRQRRLHSALWAAAMGAKTIQPLPCVSQTVLGLYELVASLYFVKQALINEFVDL